MAARSGISYVLNLKGGWVGRRRGRGWGDGGGGGGETEGEGSEVTLRTRVRDESLYYTDTLYYHKNAPNTTFNEGITAP